jgi:PelA/Pel-15E family pectate lyase
VTALLLSLALLAPERIAALPAVEREAWQRYVETSRKQAEIDREGLARELKAVGLEVPSPAPAGPPFGLLIKMAPRTLADVLVSFQTPSGGWSKNLDLTRRREPGQAYSAEKGWRWVGTFDNDATVGPMRALADAARADDVPSHAAAFRRGIEYVLLAQFPNGCWPQVYPLEGGYHDAATFNDDAMVGLLELLRDVAESGLGPVDAGVRRRAGDAVVRATDCILASQVVVGGKPTVWSAQHDPLTLQPVGARSYEHASLSGLESAGVMDFLMCLSDAADDPRVRAAVDGAAAWFRANAIHGLLYTAERERVAQEGAGPLWARFYEIGTNRPIFSNRDGVVRYDWRELEEERRRGYAWYTDRPASTLRRYESW